MACPDLAFSDPNPNPNANPNPNPILNPDQVAFLLENAPAFLAHVKATEAAARAAAAKARSSYERFSSFMWQILCVLAQIRVPPLPGQLPATSSWAQWQQPAGHEGARAAAGVRRRRAGRVRLWLGVRVSWRPRRAVR